MTKSSEGAEAEQNVGTLLNGIAVKQRLAHVQSVTSTPASSRQSSAVHQIRPSSRVAAFQQASEAYHEALLEKRLELVQKMHNALANTSTVAYQSIAAYSHLLDGGPAMTCVHVL